MRTGRAGWSEIVADRLAALRNQNRWREPRSFDAFGHRGTRAGVPLTSFASNDYLGLTAHPAVIEAARSATDRWGTGATAARLIVGSRPVHHELESALSSYHGSEACALFSTGYQANLGVITALVDDNTTVLSDELNHASIVDAIRLARCDKVIIPHRDSAAFRKAAENVRNQDPTRRMLIVSDAVFSMDGDTADVAGLLAVATEFDALVVFDVAHLVFGGAAFHTAIQDAAVPVLVVGTLSKTLASQGGYVAGPRPFVQLLENTARSYIFTTGLAPGAAAAALAALSIVSAQSGEALRQQLRNRVDLLEPGAPSPVLPLQCGDEARTLALAKHLLEAGFLVPAIRPPTVAANACRLRITVTAAHDVAEIEAFRSTLDASLPGWSIG